jgi:hypothetical protein
MHAQPTVNSTACAVRMQSCLRSHASISNSHNYCSYSGLIIATQSTLMAVYSKHFFLNLYRVESGRPPPPPPQKKDADPVPVSLSLITIDFFRLKLCTPNAEDGSGRKYAAQEAAYLPNIEFEKIKKLVMKKIPNF